MDRIALVIGNSNYQYVRPLTNPKNDANDMAGILEKLNFKVLKYLDLTLNEMECAVNLFVQELDDNATGLFYYAGHGMQIDGENYIVPTDCQLSDIGKTKVSCFCLDTYFKKISAYKFDDDKNRLKSDWAFVDCPNLTIHAPAGSYAEQYAKENHIPFVAEE